MPQELNSARFLDTFAELEKYFNHEYSRGFWKGFKQILKESSRINPVIYQFKEELFEFADLRNAIVHNRDHNYQVIAEPHQFVVDRFQYIKEQIINPVKVSVFHKKVFTCLLTDPIESALTIIRDHQISHIPVYDKNHTIIEILHSNNIAFWLANHQLNQMAGCKIEDVLKTKEYSNNYELIASDISVFHAAELFRKSHKKPPVSFYYDALLITQNGKADQELKGIITLNDIAEYL